MKTNLVLTVLVIFVFMLNFEFKAVKELDRTHFGWYCYISINLNQPSGHKFKGAFDQEFQNIFINSQHIDEIRDQITDILEREDQNYEIQNNFSSDNSDASNYL